MISAPPPCGRLLRRDAHRQVQTFGARCGGCEGPCRPRGPVVGGPVVSGTFVLPSPPAVSPALGTGECWLRRRDFGLHVPQCAQDLTPPPTIAPRTRSPTLGVLPGCLLTVRMPSRPWPMLTTAFWAAQFLGSCPK